MSIDTLMGFHADEQDKIVLDRTTFTNLEIGIDRITGTVHLTGFQVVNRDAGVAASSASIVYNSSNGKLFYNQFMPGSSLGISTQFAVLTGLPALSASAFLVQA